MGQIDTLLIRDVYTSKGSIFDWWFPPQHMIFCRQANIPGSPATWLLIRISY
jgi:hypothetical protein